MCILPMKNRVEVEATITVRRNDCQATDIAFEFDEESSLQRIKIGPEDTVHKINTAKDREELIVRYARAGISCQRIEDNSIWATSPSCSACKFFSVENVSILGSRSFNTNSVSYRVLVPSMPKLHAIERDLRKLGMDPIVTDIYESSRTILTKRENEVIRTCYRQGFFDPVRKNNLTQMARELGISPASLSELIRRALKKIITDYIDTLE